jgi:hypothetical protein
LIRSHGGDENFPSENPQKYLKKNIKVRGAGELSAYFEGSGN